MKMKQSEFAELYGVNRHTVVRWEKDQVQVSKSTWEKLFK
jgi:DNA-binding transcriptional regulator YiaG